MRSTLLILVAGCIAINLSLIQAKSLRLKKRAAFYIANETACIVDSIVYYNGDPIPTDDPCEACKCRPPGFACVLRECEVKPGCRAVRKAGHCCPEYVCGCEHNGRMYRDGDEIRDSQNPCYTCHCQGSAIACAFVDCFFRVDCAPDYVPGECCPRYDHCSPLAPTTNEPREETSKAIQPTTSQAPIEKDNPETTIKVEVFTELSLFGLPHLGIDEFIDEIEGSQPASETGPADSNQQPGSEILKDQSTSVATTPETSSTTTAENNHQPDSTAPIFYIPKEEIVGTEETSEESVKELEPKEPLPSEAVSDDSPKAEKVVTSDVNQSSAKPELYVSSDDSKLAEELTTESSDKIISSEVPDIKDTKQDSSNQKETESEKKFSTISSYPVTAPFTSEKTIADAQATTPIPVLFLNAKISHVSSEEKEKIHEETTTGKVAEEPAITAEIIKEANDQNQTTTVPPRSTEETKTVPPRSTEETKTVPPRSTEETKTVPPRNTEETKTVPPRNTEETTTVPPRNTEETTTVPPRNTEETTTVPPRSTEETTNVVTVTTSKSNRIGKQNDDKADVAATELSDTEKSTNIEIEAKRRDALLPSTIFSEGTSLSTLSEKIPSVSTTLEGVQTDGGTSTVPEEKAPSIYSKNIDSELTSLSNSAEHAITTEAKESPQTAKSTESIDETATESNVVITTIADLPQTEVTITSDSKTTLQASKITYKE